MKFLALLCVVALGFLAASAQEFSSGDLYGSKTASASSVVVEETLVHGDAKPTNPGARPKKQIMKRTNLRPDHRSKALFKGLGNLNLNDDAQVARFQETISQEELIRMLEFSVGESWQDEYVLPAEDLSLMEVVELSAELNERNIQISREAQKPTRQYGRNDQGPGYCFCHGTAHHYATEATREHESGSFVHGVDFKGYPYWGIRMFKHKIPNGHNNGASGGDSDVAYSPHQSNPYQFRDCLLTQEDYFSQSYSHCCTGFCVIDPRGQQPSFVESLLTCNTDNVSYTYENDINNNWDCVRPCTTTECSCGDLSDAIHEKYELGQDECSCEARVTANNQCNCDAEGNIPWAEYEDTCTCELLLNDDVNCTCLEGLQNRGCTCEDAFQWIDEKQYFDTEFSNTCDCENMIGVANDQGCGCDLGLEICDVTCCEFYETETIVDNCTDAVHASFIGSQVQPGCPCSNDAVADDTSYAI